MKAPRDIMRDIWRCVVRFLKIVDAIGLRRVSREFKLVVDELWFSRLCRLANVRGSASPDPDTFVRIAYLKPAYEPRKELPGKYTLTFQRTIQFPDYCDGLVKPVIHGFAHDTIPSKKQLIGGKILKSTRPGTRPDIHKIPEGIIVLHRRRFIFVPWVGKPSNHKNKSIWNEATALAIHHAGKLHLICARHEEIDHEAIDGQFGGEPPEGTYVRNVLFSLVSYDHTTRTFKKVIGPEIELDTQYLPYLHAFSRGSDNILADFCSYIPQVLNKPKTAELSSRLDPFLRLVGRNFLVRNFSIYRFNKDGTEKYIAETGEKERLVDLSETDGSPIFELGRFLCIVIKTNIVIFDDKGTIVREVEIGHPIYNGTIYHDDTIISFDKTIITCHRGEIEVFEHELLRGVVTVGERVVMFDGESVLFV